jgi:hypothetical protein
LHVEPTPIPFNVARDRLGLTWADVAWGYQKGWLDAASVVEQAVAQLEGDDDASSAVVELAGLTRSELADVPFLLEKVVGEAGPETDLIPSASGFTWSSRGSTTAAPS